MPGLAPCDAFANLRRNARCRLRDSSTSGRHTPRQSYRFIPNDVKSSRGDCRVRMPAIAIRPTWYTFVDSSDLDEIVDSHLKNGRVVERLVLPPNVGR